MPVWRLDKATHAGEIIKSHGYSGSVRVAFLFPGLSKKLNVGDSVYIEWMEKPVPYSIHSIQWTGDDGAIIELADVSSEDEARKLVGRNVILPEDILSKKKTKPELGDILIGYKVVDEDGKALGEVIEFYDTGAQNLLEVKHEAGEFLMPYHPDFVINENKRKKVLTVRLPGGMIDLEQAEQE